MVIIVVGKHVAFLLIVDIPTEFLKFDFLLPFERSKQANQRDQKIHKHAIGLYRLPVQQEARLAQWGCALSCLVRVCWLWVACERG